MRGLSYRAQGLSRRSLRRIALVLLLANTVALADITGKVLSVTDSVRSGVVPMTAFAYNRASLCYAISSVSRVDLVSRQPPLFGNGGKTIRHVMEHKGEQS